MWPGGDGHPESGGHLASKHCPAGVAMVRQCQGALQKGLHRGAPGPSQAGVIADGSVSRIHRGA